MHSVHRDISRATSKYSSQLARRYREINFFHAKGVKGVKHKRAYTPKLMT